MSGSAPPRRVAVVGAGPAGIFVADALAKSAAPVEVDLLEKLPAPFGLVRYGVAPDHPRIKRIITALHKLLDRGDIRLLSNVEVGTDLSTDDLRELYDAVVLTTGADRDASLDVPGVDLPGSHGAAQFVAWYGGHPDAPRSWALDAEQVAVVGAGNVALDVARMLARRPADLLSTDIPETVAQGLVAGRTTDVHVVARRGPAQARFSPLELRELGEVPGVRVVVDPEDLQLDEASQRAVEADHQTAQVVATLTAWAGAGDDGAGTADGAPVRRVHLHFLHRPVELLGEDRVTGLRTERMVLAGDGSVRGTGRMHDLPVQAVYRAVGYRSSPVPGVPFDPDAGVVPNAAGRVLDESGAPVPGVYASGWVKRGPVGLIGSTRGDANETAAALLEDLPSLPAAPRADADAVTGLLRERGVRYVEWTGWLLVDAYERELGQAAGRERTKVVDREDMLRAALRAAEAEATGQATVQASGEAHGPG